MDGSEVLTPEVLLIWWWAKVCRDGSGAASGGRCTYALNSHCRLSGMPLELANACNSRHRLGQRQRSGQSSDPMAALLIETM